MCIYIELNVVGIICCVCRILNVSWVCCVCDTVDHSRVKLIPLDDTEDGSDYINASYIPVSLYAAELFPDWFGGLNPDDSQEFSSG